VSEFRGFILEPDDDYNSRLPNGETVHEASARLAAIVVPMRRRVLARVGMFQPEMPSAWVLPKSADPYRTAEDGEKVERLFGLPVIWSEDELTGVFYADPA